MLVIKGKFAEPRVYLWYVFAILRPGIEVPTFDAPRSFDGNIERLAENEQRLVIDEGRRQLDRQLTDLDRVKSQAGTLLTISLAELAVLSASAQRAYSQGPLFIVLWAVSAAFVALAAGGAASLLTSQARFKRIDTHALASGPVPMLPGIAREYADAVGYGEETIRTRITVLRDGVSLAVLAALLYAVLWAFISVREANAGQPNTPPTGVTDRCNPTCTTNSPSEPTPTTTPASQDETSPTPERSSPTR
jgi:hypothetical protein